MISPLTPLSQSLTNETKGYIVVIQWDASNTTNSVYIQTPESGIKKCGAVGGAAVGNDPITLPVTVGAGTTSWTVGDTLSGTMTTRFFSFFVRLLCPPGFTIVVTGANNRVLCVQCDTIEEALSIL